METVTTNLPGEGKTMVTQSLQRGFYRPLPETNKKTVTRRKVKRGPVAAFSLAVALAVSWGWLERNEYWYTADHGAGYAFGIIGLSLMLLLLLYPLRKHWKPMSRLLPVRHWFRMHMIFGVLGPLFIVFHANFRLGSFNSTVALFSMLLVAASGLVGRYVYAKIHKGLYGETIRYKDLVNDYQLQLTDDSVANDMMASVKRQLDEDRLSTPGLIICQLKVRWGLRRESNPARRSAMHMLMRMARLRVFSRLFSLWHVFHLPFFFMMCLAAAVHVVVVHMY